MTETQHTESGNSPPDEITEANFLALEATARRDLDQNISWSNRPRSTRIPVIKGEKKPNLFLSLADLAGGRVSVVLRQDVLGLPVELGVLLRSDSRGWTLLTKEGLHWHPLTKALGIAAEPEGAK